MEYSEWNLTFFPDRENYKKVVAAHIEGRPVHRYPFHFLGRIGSELIISNTDGMENRARVSAYQYAKRKGWKIKGVIDFSTLPSGVRFSDGLTLTRIA